MADQDSGGQRDPARAYLNASGRRTMAADRNPLPSRRESGGSANGRWTTRRMAEAPSIDEAVDVGMDTRGDAMVVWHEEALNGGGSAIWTRIRPAGRGWETAKTIPGTHDGSPSLAVDARGDALVTWQDKRGIEAAARPAARLVLAEAVHGVNARTRRPWSGERWACRLGRSRRCPGHLAGSRRHQDRLERIAVPLIAWATAWCVTTPDPNV
jgi:hypothetical protein